jgi:hypothetical protein
VRGTWYPYLSLSADCSASPSRTDTEKVWILPEGVAHHEAEPKGDAEVENEVSPEHLGRGNISDSF